MTIIIITGYTFGAGYTFGTHCREVDRRRPSEGQWLIKGEQKMNKAAMDTLI
jgi:hypothetical protein